ncbi:MAG: hypothetical protein BroJett040_19860 [Oligoflexia bacterium]|nr:MAG: hypothetical protein BroJett040_19860 [Oligoflexia bacterium]
MTNQWDPQKIKELRKRLGMSQSDLARRLHVESVQVIRWELGELEPLEPSFQELDLLAIQAELFASQVSQTPLAEAMMDENEKDQVDSDSVANRYKENN